MNVLKLSLCVNDFIWIWIKKNFGASPKNYCLLNLLVISLNQLAKLIIFRLITSIILKKIYSIAPQIYAFNENLS